jgi:hypothetical protein
VEQANPPLLIGIIEKFRILVNSFLKKIKELEKIFWWERPLKKEEYEEPWAYEFSKR